MPRDRVHGGHLDRDRLEPRVRRLHLRAGRTLRDPGKSHTVEHVTTLLVRFRVLHAVEPTKTPQNTLLSKNSKKYSRSPAIHYTYERSDVHRT